MKSIKKMEKHRISSKRWAYITFEDDEEVVLFGGKKFINGTVYYLRDKEQFSKKISYFYARHPFNNRRSELDIYNFFFTDDIIKYRVSKEELAEALMEYGFKQDELDDFLLFARY